MFLLVLLLTALTTMFALQERWVNLPANDYAALNRVIAAKQRQAADTTVETPALPMAELAGQHSVYHRKERFYFDPNGLPEDKWIRLGLSPAQARAVKRYEAGGGRFRTRQDVSRLIVVSAELYAELEPFIVLPDAVAPSDKTEQYPANRPTARLTSIELNAADTSVLVQLEGIGPVFARRIVAYRQRLGGFHHAEQLLEVFGFEQERLDQIASRLRIDSTYIRKINVNTADASELRKHPYLNPTVAKALVSYRTTHGPFRNLPELMNCHLVTADLYRKLAPYLTL